MDGRGRGRPNSPEIQREFAGSRLEEQILIRAFELVAPAIRRTLTEDEQSATACGAEQFHSVLAKGA
jgi:hypothetical protein